MPSWSRAALALIAILGPNPAQSPTTDPGPDEARMPWQRSLADAEALAKATGRPLLLVLNMDGESASDRVHHESYRDPAFTALARRAVCVAASVFRHNPVDHDERGARIDCPRLPGMTCGEHMAAEPELFARYLLDGERVAPRHVLVRPDGSVAFDLSLCFDLRDVDRALAAATATLAPWSPPPSRTWAELAGRRDADGRAQLEAAIAATTTANELTTALAALAADGDAGALPALRLVAARLPDAPLDALLRTADALGLAGELRLVLRHQAQRIVALPGALAAPAEFDQLLAAIAHPDAELRTKTWLCALAATRAEHASLQAALARTFGADPLVVEAAWQQPVDLAALLRLGAAITAAPGNRPAAGLPKRALAAADVLHEQLRQLDERAADADDAERLAALGIASLDLGRVQLEAGAANAPLLLEDADRYLAAALSRLPNRYDLWLERARTAYYRSEFAQQRTCGERALAIAGFPWPPAPDRLPALLHDLRGIEAVTWIADADARLVAADDLQTPGQTIARLRSALLGLGLAAVSPFGDANDQLGFASFAESLGLVREELAILLAAQRRLPSAPDVRQAVYAALWLAGRPELAPACADSALEPTPSADALWWSAHARVLLAESLRRRERPQAAAASYAAALAPFAAAGVANPDYRASVQSYHAVAWLGRGLALAQGGAADRQAAASCLGPVLATGADVLSLRDGLGYDALDFVDHLLEWRDAGPSPIAPLQLLDQVPATAPQFVFWATAVSDSALREALRADGRNPDRVEADTVDAAGQPIRAMVGRPTELGDRYLAAAIAAGERASSHPASDDAARTAHAQALVIQVERQLQRDPAAALAAPLVTAAQLLGVGGAPPADAAGPTLAAFAQRLRQQLGPARPRQRDGR
jgi:hypothetical protein